MSDSIICLMCFPGYSMQGIDHLYLIFPSIQCVLMHNSLSFHVDQLAMLLEDKYSSIRQRLMRIHLFYSVFRSNPLRLQKVLAMEQHKSIH